LEGMEEKVRHAPSLSARPPLAPVTHVFAKTKNGKVVLLHRWVSLDGAKIDHLTHELEILEADNAKLHLLVEASNKEAVAYRLEVQKLSERAALQDGFLSDNQEVLDQQRKLIEEQGNTNLLLKKDLKVHGILFSVRIVY